MDVYFVGIDLGWVSGPSGLAILEWRKPRLHLLHLSRLADRAALLPTVHQHVSSAACYVAVDAPVVVRNHSGMRAADRQAHRLFSRQKAGCYPVHLGMPFTHGILDFVSSWQDSGFLTDLPTHPLEPARRIFEVYPHAASIRLFGLPEILPYKKGLVSARRQALQSFRNLLSTGLAQRQPRLPLPSLPAIPSGGQALKEVEDQLDAVLCAYVAAHLWFWGWAKNNRLGEPGFGEIVVPSF